MKNKSLLTRSGAAVCSFHSSAGQKHTHPPQLRVEQEEETLPSLSTVSTMGITQETDITMKTVQFRPRVTLTKSKPKIERSFFMCSLYFKITVRELKPTAKYSLSFRDIFGKASVNLRQDISPLVGQFHTHTLGFLGCKCHTAHAVISHPCAPYIHTEAK